MVVRQLVTHFVWTNHEVNLVLFQAFVGYKSSQHFHVFELTRQLPRFAMYCRLSNNSPVLPKSHVRFRVNERTARVAIWLNQNFLVGEELDASDGPIKVAFSSLREKQQELRINMETVRKLKLPISCTHVANRKSFFKDGSVLLECDNMDLCGDVVQSLAEYLGLEDLECECDFPDEFNWLESLLQEADELQSVRQRLSAEMADHSGMIRTLVVRAEDSRLMMDM